MEIRATLDRSLTTTYITIATTTNECTTWTASGPASARTTASSTTTSTNTTAIDGERCGDQTHAT
eukprot:5723561-Pyramimonas_sp.AAC.1